MVIEAAKTGAHAIGIELFPILHLICLIRKRLHPRLNANVEFKCKNLFYENLSSADVVFFFGTAAPLKKRLPEKLERELKP